MGVNRGNRANHKKWLREMAEKRNADWAAKPLEVQLAELTKFNPGGAKRQKARIRAKLTKAQ